MNSDATGLRNLTNYPAFDGDPAWSPDGREIAFISNRNGNTSVFRMLADGSGPAIQVTPDETSEMEVNWGLEGICFLSNKPQEEENDP